MSRILDSILRLKDSMDSDWTEELDRIGILQDLSPLYHLSFTQEIKNRILAYIVLAYDNDSGWIELHKDRDDNKEKIIQRLGANLTDKIIINVLRGGIPEVEDTIEWFIDQQKDWRWKSILTCFQYHSRTMRFASTDTVTGQIMPPDEEGNAQYRYLGEDKISSINLNKGKMIEEAIKRRRMGEDLLKEIQKEFVKLDTVLEKEGKMKATESIDIMSHEKYIAARNKARL